MGIINNIVRGITSQFGREIGRAAANSILKGANSYTIESKSYEGRIKPSDSDIVKAIKEMKKVSFVTTDKGNISRLIQITDNMMPFIKFNGVETLLLINDFKVLVELYNQKYEHGKALISDNIKTKEFNFLKRKKTEFDRLMDKFNSDVKEFVVNAKEITLNNRKLKKHFIKNRLKFLFGFIIIFILSVINKFIFRSEWFVVLTFSSFVGIVIQIIRIIIISLTSQNKIDIKYNSEYLFFNKFSVN